jgi:hypothetical protein
MNRAGIVAALTILACFAQGVFGATLSFQAEADRATKALSCPRPTEFHLYVAGDARH